MKTLDDFYQIAFVMLTSVGGGTIVIAAFSSWLGKVWANRILQSDKAKYTKELDEIRHQFKIELNQLSIIHENQKNSFKRVIVSLQKSIKALGQEYDEEWFPISRKYYDELKQVVIEESLFLGSSGEKALEIYLNFFSRAISFQEDPHPKDRDLRNIYEHMIFMTERLREYFRKRIGLSEEPDPLLDIYLLAACLLINDYQFEKIDFQTKSILKFNFDTSPQALIDRIKDNIHILKSELNKLVTFLENDPEKKKHYFLTLTTSRNYLKLLQKA
jgi:hypothetical protein